MKAIFLDIEATGLNPLVHQPIDLALKVMDMTRNSIIGEYQSLLYHPKEVWEEHDPESLQINGYSWEDVAKGRPLADVKKDVMTLFNRLGIQRGKAVFICQNPAFDRSFFIKIIDVYTQEKLHWPYHWLDLASMYWALLAKHQSEKGWGFPKEINLSKNTIAELYGLPSESHPHRAMQGVDHLIECYQAVLAEGVRTNSYAER